MTPQELQIFTPKPREVEWFNLGSLSSVFRAENFTAIRGVLRILPPEAEGKKAIICSDSEAMIKAIVSPLSV